MHLVFGIVKVSSYLDECHMYALAGRVDRFSKFVLVPSTALSVMAKTADDASSELSPELAQTKAKAFVFPRFITDVSIATSEILVCSRLASLDQVVRGGNDCLSCRPTHRTRAVRH